VVKDILGHVSIWEEESLKYLPLILRGEKTPRYSKLYGGIDAFNAQMTLQIQKLTLDEVLTRFDQAHQRLTAFYRVCLMKRSNQMHAFLRRLKYDTYHHYPNINRQSFTGARNGLIGRKSMSPFAIGSSSYH